MTDTNTATQVVLDWMALYMRRSVHDMMQFNKTTGLSLSQLNILLWLHYHSHCEVTNLATIMQVSPAAASQMVERMVREDLVQRVETPSDRRTRQVHLTEHGRQVVEATIQAREAWVGGLVESLSPEQRMNLVTLMGTMIQKTQELDSQRTLHTQF